MSVPEDSSPDQRRFTRVPFVASVLLDIFPDQYACTLVDISLKGALIERDQVWETSIGTPCSLTVELVEGGTSIHMKGSVAHCERGRLGIRCADIDLESMTVLRRLIELNLGDEAVLNREIQSMVRASNSSE
ncbi:MAG: PilZ domain-containing protein [Thiobacillus sp.]|nr:PilZ domain-containing protein [Thiobacillus sp.]